MMPGRLMGERRRASFESSRFREPIISRDCASSARESGFSSLSRSFSLSAPTLLDNVNTYDGTVGHYAALAQSTTRFCIVCRLITPRARRWWRQHSGWVTAYSTSCVSYARIIYLAHLYAYNDSVARNMQGTYVYDIYRVSGQSLPKKSS